jgi:peptide/nickel transport system ATP-binding protein
MLDMSIRARILKLLLDLKEEHPRRQADKDLPRGEIPDAVRPPAGCRFHPRCPEALLECGWERRDLGDLIERHLLELIENGEAPVTRR